MSRKPQHKSKDGPLLHEHAPAQNPEVSPIEDPFEPEDATFPEQERQKNFEK